MVKKEEEHAGGDGGLGGGEGGRGVKSSFLSYKVCKGCHRKGQIKLSALKGQCHEILDTFFK